MYFVFPVVCAFAVVVQLVITTATAAKTDFNTDFFILLSVLMFVFVLSRFSIFISRLSICKCISYFDTTKEKREKIIEKR